VGGVLAAYGIGLLGAASAKLFASGFFALRDTRTPVKISVATLLLSGVLAALLLRPLGVAGIALGSSVGASVTLMAQLRLLDARIGPVLDSVTWRHCGVSVAAALGAAGAGVVAAGAGAELGSLGRAGVALGAFGAVYAGVTLLLRHPDAVRVWMLRR
jgi:putative peptidoglycan lipid II flippase